MVGAPTEGPEFIIGEYAFLLESEDPLGLAPQLLGRIYTAEGNFRQFLARVNDRSALWYEYNEGRAASAFGRGSEMLQRMAASGALNARVKELTRWLREDLAELIPTFKSIFPELYKVLESKYPGKRFIRFWPKDDPTAPPL